MTAESTVNSIIENAIARSDESANQAIGFSQQAQTAAQIIFQFAALPIPTRPDVLLPVFNPEEDLSALFSLSFDNATTDFEGDFLRETNDFINDWFPDWDECLKNTVDDWICDTITAGGVGLPPAAEAALWERERERELVETSRLQSESINSFASRGFTLPGGVLVDEQAKIAQAGADRIAAASRDRAIQDEQIRIDMLKFAVEKGVQMRLGIAEALVNYLNAWLKVPALAIEKARSIVDAKTRLWDQSSRYYEAVIGAARLLLDYDQIRIDSAIREQDNFVRASIGAIDAKVRAAVGAAEAMGAIAAAALGSLNSLASIESATIETG